MSNLFRKFVDSRPVRTPLDFGHNENIIITKVDTGERKAGETTINANTFITLNKVDAEGKVLGSHEGSFWNLDPTQQTSNIARNITDQFTQMAAIVSAVGGDLAQFEEDIYDIDGLGEDEELAAFASNKKQARLVQDSFQQAFMNQVEPIMGAECPKMKCKLVSNKKGFLNFSREINWIIPMDGDQKIAEVTDTEKAIYQEALKGDSKDKQEKPDNTDKPDGEKKTGNSAFNGL